MGIMLSASFLKLYAVGTAFTVLAFFYGIADSFGGLMYPQNHHYTRELDRHRWRPLPPTSHLREPTKNVGS